MSGNAGAGSILDQIRTATQTASQQASRGRARLDRSLEQASLFLAPVLGLYLGIAVMRLAEVFPVLAVPRLPMILALGFIAMLVGVVPPEEWRRSWQTSLPIRLIALLTGVAVGSALVGIYRPQSLEFFQNRYVVALVVYLTCAMFLRERRALRITVMLFVLSVAVVSYTVVRDYDPNAIILNEDGEPIAPEVMAARPDLRRLQQVGASLDSNDYGAILAVAFPLALWLGSGSVLRRMLWTPVAGLMVLGLVPTQSRGSMVGFAAAALVIAAVGAQGWRRWVTTALLVGFGLGFVGLASGIGAFARFSDISMDDYNVTSGEGRLFFWKQGIVWTLKRPWGYGIGNFTTYFEMLNGTEKAAHSMWIQYAVELGIIGVGAFILLWITLSRGLFRQYFRSFALPMPRETQQAEAALASHMLAAVVAAMVTGTFLSVAYAPSTFMVLGLATATVYGFPAPADADAEAAAPVARSGPESMPSPPLRQIRSAARPTPRRR